MREEKHAVYIRRLDHLITVLVRLQLGRFTSAVTCIVSIERHET